MLGHCYQLLPFFCGFDPFIALFTHFYQFFYKIFDDFPGFFFYSLDQFSPIFEHFFVILDEFSSLPIYLSKFFIQSSMIFNNFTRWVDLISYQTFNIEYYRLYSNNFWNSLCKYIFDLNIYAKRFWLRGTACLSDEEQKCIRKNTFNVFLNHLTIWSVGL